ncbi:MAG: DUF1223 domain-containing protein [Rhodothalassiaceae bacterium]
MKAFILFAALFAVAVPLPAHAGERLIVAELFTSQGCSSCPPADRLLAQLAQQDDILALSFAVDYWDYLGWTDKFGAPAHSNRQRDYNAAMGRRSIYTPQLILNGRHQAVGSRTSQVRAALDAARADRATGVSVEVSPDGTIAISGPAGGAEVLAVWYSPHERVAVRRGENRGRELHYTNIVLGMKKLRQSARDGDRLHLPMQRIAEAGTRHVAVIVQQRNGGAVLGAADVVLPPSVLAPKG